MAKYHNLLSEVIIIKDMEDFINNLRNIASNIGTAANAMGSIISGNPAMLIGNLAGRAQKEATNYKTPVEATTDSLIRLFNNNNSTSSAQNASVQDAMAKGKWMMEDAEQKYQEQQNNSTTPSETTTTSTEEYEYEYKPGDTFGQVLLDLGISDGSNLWGPAGDVAYYTQQLREQDMLDANGNVKLGKKFRLKKRPANV